MKRLVKWSSALLSAFRTLLDRDETKAVRMLSVDERISQLRSEIAEREVAIANLEAWKDEPRTAPRIVEDPLSLTWVSVR